MARQVLLRPAAPAAGAGDDGSLYRGVSAEVTRRALIPAQAGIQSVAGIWVPAFAGTSGPLCRRAHTNSGQGTRVDLTVFIAIASLTARETPPASKGQSGCIASQGYLLVARWSM